MSHPQHCPGCGNRCSLDAPSCTTGERYARSLRAAPQPVYQFIYQICTRSSGARYMPSPGWISNAS